MYFKAEIDTSGYEAAFSRVRRKVRILALVSGIVIFSGVVGLGIFIWLENIAAKRHLDSTIPEIYAILISACLLVAGLCSVYQGMHEK